MNLPDEFDYVVVGAGSAGCVVAARLSESGQHTVALIEAGGEDNGFWIRVPLGYGKLYEDPRYNWMYESEPEPELGGIRSFQPRGKVLGGTGSINGMIHMRGQRQDFDLWRQLGNVGWSYDDVLPYFKKSEDNEKGADEFHGAGGPLLVSDPPRDELTEAFITAAEQAGYTRNDDYNGADQEGFGYNQFTVRRGRRSSTASAYLRPARGRGNLKLITNALAKRILFSGTRAAGIEFRRGGESQTILARREVIIASGVFNAPQLLQLSGVGPAELLRANNIPVIADLAGVGDNLQDHFTAGATYRCTRPITINDAVNNPLRRLAMGIRYVLFHSGMMASNATSGAGCIRTDPALSAPNVKLSLRLWSRASGGGAKARRALDSFSGFGVSMALVHPESRGTVRIKSGDGAMPPAIRFNFFSTEQDRVASVAALRAIRRIMGMPAIAPYVAEEILPGPQCSSSDEDLIAYCRKKGNSNSHAVGTCKMGIDEDAVVDPRLRVRNVAGLRVIDASVMPRIVAGNTNAATIMIAEKGSAMVIEDASAS